MNKTTTADLRAAYPEQCADLVESGRIAERDRVALLLDLGAKCPSFELAHASIRDGSALSPALIASFYDRISNRRDIDARQAESDDAGAVVDGYTKPSSRYGESALADRVDQMMGSPERTGATR